MDLHQGLLAVGSLILAIAVADVQGVEYQVINNATGTPGGARFDRDIGLDYTKQLLINASSFIWKTFHLAENQTRKVSRVLLIVDPTDGKPCTDGGVIHLSAQYIAGYEGDVRTEVTGLLYRELTHVWLQSGRNMTAQNPLMEGVAAYVRLKAGYARADWARPGEGQRWDERPDVTARFLEFADTTLNHGDGFAMHDANVWMQNGLYDLLFLRLVGQTLYEIWKLYRGIPLEP